MSVSNHGRASCHASDTQKPFENLAPLLCCRYGGTSAVTTTIDTLAEVLNMYTRKGKAIPAELKTKLGKVSKELNFIAKNLNKLADACGYR